MTIQRPLHQSVRKLPSNVDAGTITVAINRTPLWADVESKLGDLADQGYYDTASGLKYMEVVTEHIRRFIPNARVVITVGPDEIDVPTYVGLSPNFKNQDEVMHRIMNILKDIADIPNAWLVLRNSPEHVRIAKKYGREDAKKA